MKKTLSERTEFFGRYDGNGAGGLASRSSLPVPAGFLPRSPLLGATPKGVQQKKRIDEKMQKQSGEADVGRSGHQVSGGRS